jgi:hypothetical protein
LRRFRSRQEAKPWASGRPCSNLVPKLVPDSTELHCIPQNQFALTVELSLARAVWGPLIIRRPWVRVPPAEIRHCGFPLCLLARCGSDARSAKRSRSSSRSGSASGPPACAYKWRDAGPVRSEPRDGSPHLGRAVDPSRRMPYPVHDADRNWAFWACRPGRPTG